MMMRLAIATCLLLSLFVGEAAAAYGRPYRGAVPWSILLCTYQGQPAPPRTPSYYATLFTSKSYAKGIGAFVDKVSYGSASLAGSTARGWYTIPYTLETAKAKSRGDSWNDCIQAAKAGGYSVPAGQLIAVVTYPSRDLWGAGGVGAYLPFDAEVGAYGHECMHGFGLVHSYSNDPTYKNADWAGIGEYDDCWDVMSYAHAYTTSTGVAGNGNWGPGLNGYAKDRLGWMPKSAIYRFGAAGEKKAILSLASLTTYDYNQKYLKWISAISKVDVSVFGGRRRTSRSLKGIFDTSTSLSNFNNLFTSTPTPIKPTPTPTPTKSIFTGNFGDTFNSNTNFNNLFTPTPTPTPTKGSSLSDIFNSNTNLKDILGLLNVQTFNKFENPVTNTFVDRSLALPSFLKEVTKFDTAWLNLLTDPTAYLYIRVPIDSGDPFHYYTIEHRRKTDVDAGIPSDYQVLIHEVKLIPGGNGAYGAFLIRNLTAPGKPPASSVSGYGVTISVLSVGELAKVQITASSASTFRKEAYGPNTCKSGFVWREADNSDYVCVTGATRTAAKNDNLAHPTRVEPICKTSPSSCGYGANQCKVGFVWRDAFPGDQICVLASVRDAAKADNAAAFSRLLNQNA